MKKKKGSGPDAARAKVSPPPGATPIKPTDPECSLGYLIGSVTRLLLRTVDRELRPLGITATQLAPLLALSERPSMLQRDLVKHLSVTQPAMVATLAKLERESLIERHPDEHDGRASLISLTAKGRSLVEAPLPPGFAL